jgi:hypothetical protein
MGAKFFQTLSVRKFIACLLIILWLCKQPAIGMNWTLGIVCGTLVSWMPCWAVLPSQEDCCTGVALVAVGGGRRGGTSVIGGTVPGILLHVSRRCTRFVNFSTCFVVGLGAFMIGGASDIRRRSSIEIISWGGTTLCSLLGITLCWSPVGATAWGTRWKSSSGRIHAWHGLVRKSGPPGHIVLSDNFACTNVSTLCCFIAVIAPKVDTILFVNSCK